ncbi:MAG: peptidylprolyl isomerase, partial [Candidatus Aminicenantes bacterium]
QFFITHVPTDWLDQKHTVFGEVVGQEDQEVVNRIQKGDKIQSIAVTGDTSTLMTKIQPRLEEWNQTLDQRFPT